MTKYLLTTSIFAIMLLGACSKDDPGTTGKNNNSNNSTATATLRLSVIHVDGSQVMGAQVDLYTSLSDFQNQTNSVKSATTDQSGDVYFDKLELKQYWFFVSFDGYTNAQSVTTTGHKLAKDEHLEKITQLRK
ncbi:hypothetical protein GC194_12805 [bacterium]|nr:hypothetical protein [bacterium]